MEHPSLGYSRVSRVVLINGVETRRSFYYDNVYNPTEGGVTRQELPDDFPTPPLPWHWYWWGDYINEGEEGAVIDYVRGSEEMIAKKNEEGFTGSIMIY